MSGCRWNRGFIHRVAIAVVFGFLSNETVTADDSARVDANQTRSRPAAAGEQVPPLSPLQQEQLDWIKAKVKEVTEREALQMLYVLVAKGGDMGPGDGWFHPSKMRYDWEWLARRAGVGPGGTLDASHFPGSAESFHRLDRDGDGTIGRDDFDWSMRSPHLRLASQAAPFFRALDGNSNGRISEKEWNEAFAKMASKKGHITPDDMRAFLFPPQRGRGGGGGEPSPLVLLKGFARQDLGSFSEGPDIGAPAPDFSLKTHDRKTTIRLSDFHGKKPVVLIFGSFT